MTATGVTGAARSPRGTTSSATRPAAGTFSTAKTTIVSSDASRCERRRSPVRASTITTGGSFGSARARNSARRDASDEGFRAARTSPARIARTGSEAPPSKPPTKPSEPSASRPPSSRNASHSSAAAARRATADRASASARFAASKTSSATSAGHVPVTASWWSPRNAPRRADRSEASIATGSNDDRASAVASASIAPRLVASSASSAAATTRDFNARLATYEPTHAFSQCGKLSAYGKNPPDRRGTVAAFAARLRRADSKYSEGVDQRNRNRVDVEDRPPPARRGRAEEGRAEEARSSSSEPPDPFFFAKKNVSSYHASRRSHASNTPPRRRT